MCGWYKECTDLALSVQISFQWFVMSNSRNTDFLYWWYQHCYPSWDGCFLLFLCWSCSSYLTCTGCIGLDVHNYLSVYCHLTPLHRFHHAPRRTLQLQWQGHVARTLAVTVASRSCLSGKLLSVAPLFSLLPLSQPLGSPTVEQHVQLYLTCTHTVVSVCKKKHLQQIPGSINTEAL